MTYIFLLESCRSFVHFELQNLDLLTYLIPSVERQFAKSKDLGQLPLVLLQFLKDLVRAPEYETREVIDQMEEEIERLSTLPSEKKSFIFMDPRLWLRSRRKKIAINDLEPEEKGHLAFFKANI